MRVSDMKSCSATQQSPLLKLVTTFTLMRFLVKIQTTFWKITVGLVGSDGQFFTPVSASGSSAGDFFPHNQMRSSSLLDPIKNTSIYEGKKKEKAQHPAGIKPTTFQFSDWQASTLTTAPQPLPKLLSKIQPPLFEQPLGDSMSLVASFSPNFST